MTKGSVIRAPAPKKMIFFSCLILIIGLMAMDFINPSLPYIMKNLSASQNATKGLMVTYLLAMSVAQLFYGTYSDNYGRRRAILIAFAIAILGFIISALSRNILMLYAARFITAIGMAGAPVISRALIVDVCHDDQTLKKAFSYFAMFSQISPAIAPLFGGVIQHYASWRTSFFTLALINLITFIFLYKIMPESHTIPTIKKLLHEQFRIYFNLMKMRRFMLFNLLSGLEMTFTLGYYSLSPFIFHNMGANAIVNGLMCIPYAVGLTSGACILSLVLYRFDSEKSLLTSMYGYLIFFILMSILTYFYIDLLLIGVFAITVGFICGIAAPLTLSLCMQDFHTDRGAASALQAFIRYFFTGLGLLCFNFIHLTHFYQLSVIFLGISVVILAVYGIELFVSKLKQSKIILQKS